MYGKLFSQMYDGTLATKGPWQALVTFQQLVILADQDGIVDMTPEAIVRRTTVPLKIIQEGLRHLQEPDPESRTPDEEGRRITLLSESRAWGWRIVNHGHYRKLRNGEERREYHRKYYRDKRKPQRASTLSTNSTNSTNSTKAVSSKQKQKCIAADRGLSLISDGWQPKPETLQALYAEIGADARPHIEPFIDVCRAKHYRYADFDAAFKKCVREDWAKLRGKPLPRADGLAL
jgi:hypothetical protein